MKHALITGGSDGLGKVTAHKLIEAGYKVTILANDPDKTKASAQELGCNYVVADVSDYDQVEKAVEQAKANAPIDILINNAGIWVQGLLEQNNPQRIRKLMEVNAIGPIYCTRAVIPGMKQKQAGRIINISSQGGLYAKAERGPYTASKWSVTGFTKAMQAELKPFNISVSGIYPGAIKNTNIFSAAGVDKDVTGALEPETVADAIVYICNLPDGINVAEFGIENLAY